MMSTHRLGSCVIGRVCDICGAEPALVRSIVTEPLVGSTSTMVGADCYGVHAAGVALVLSRDRRLVSFEVVA